MRAGSQLRLPPTALSVANRRCRHGRAAAHRALGRQEMLPSRTGCRPPRSRSPRDAAVTNRLPPTALSVANRRGCHGGAAAHCALGRQERLPSRTGCRPLRSRSPREAAVTNGLPPTALSVANRRRCHGGAARSPPAGRGEAGPRLPLAQVGLPRPTPTPPWRRPRRSGCARAGLARFCNSRSALGRPSARQRHHSPTEPATFLESEEGVCPHDNRTHCLSCGSPVSLHGSRAPAHAWEG